MSFQAKTCSILYLQISTPIDKNDRYTIIKCAIVSHAVDTTFSKIPTMVGRRYNDLCPFAVAHTLLNSTY